METLKRKIAIMLLAAMCVFTSCICLANDVAADNISGDDSTNLYFDDYDDYEDYLSDEDDSEYNDYLKETFVDYKDYLSSYFDEYTRPVTYRARVLSVEEPKDIYEFNYSYYSIEKYYTQKAVVKVLEGDQANKEFDVTYYLSTDTLGNLKAASLAKGDVIYVTLTENASGDTTSGDTSYVASVTNSSTAFDRFGGLILFAVIVALVLAIYGGKKGVVTILATALAAIIALYLIPVLEISNVGIAVIILMTILLAVAITTVISFAHLGTTSNASKAIGISVILELIALLVLYFANTMLKINGITYETTLLAENIISVEIDYQVLYYIISMIIATVFISNSVATSISKLSQLDIKDEEGKIKAMQNVVFSNIVTLVFVSLMLYIPNHMVFSANKYTATEISNSEVFISEATRILATIFAITLSMPFLSLGKNNSSKEENS